MTTMGHPEDFQVPAFRKLVMNAIHWTLGVNPRLERAEPQAGCRLKATALPAPQRLAREGAMDSLDPAREDGTNRL